MGVRGNIGGGKVRDVGLGDARDSDRTELGGYLRKIYTNDIIMPSLNQTRCHMYNDGWSQDYTHLFALLTPFDQLTSSPYSQPRHGPGPHSSFL
jgi:hypothetical protein